MSKINLNNYEAFLLDYFEGTISETDLSELRAFLVLHPELEVDLEGLELPLIPDENTKADFISDLKKTEENFSEQHIISFTEGLLSKKQEAELEAEALLDSNLAKIIKEYQKAYFTDKNLEKFEYKADLLKTEDDFVLTNRCIAYVENQLNANDRADFETELNINSILQKELQRVTLTKNNADTSILYPEKSELIKEAKVITLFTLPRVLAMAASIALIFVLSILLFNTNGIQNGNSINKLAYTKKFIFNTDSKSPVSSNSTTNNSIKNNTQTTYIAHNKNISDSSKATTNNIANNTFTAPTNITLNIQPSYTIGIANNTKSVSPTNIFTNKTDTFNTSIALNEKVEPVYVFTEEYDKDDDNAVSSTQVNKTKKPFWKKAVQLAKGANNLGLTAVNGNDNNGYAVSFNSFAISSK